MGDSFKKLPMNAHPSDMSVRAYNELLDMLQWWKRQGYSRGGDTRFGYDEASIIDVKNSTGTYCELGDVLMRQDIVVEPADDVDSFRFHPMIKGKVPDDTGKPIMIVRQPCEKNTLVPCVLAGWAVTKVRIPDGGDATLTFADVDQNTKHNLLIAQTGPAAIIWLDTVKAAGETDDIRWAIVRLGQGGGGSAKYSWFQCLSSVDDGNAPWCFANPITFDERSLTRLDLSAWTWQTDHWEYNYSVPPFNGVTGLLQAGVTVILLDSCQPRHWGAFTGDCFTAEDTGVKITVSNPSAPDNNNDHLDGNVEFEVWAMVSRQTCQDGYDAVLEEVLYPLAAARATIGVNGIPLERWVYDTLMQPGQGFVPDQYKIGVRYDADKRMWIVTGAACLPTNT
jgi:hypothetical protein